MMCPCSTAIRGVRRVGANHDPGNRVRTGLPAGAKEIRTLRPTLNASVLRGATWVPRTAPSESRPPEKRHRSAGVSATAPAAATPSSALGVRMLTRRSRCLPACGDFDIEKMRPEWRDEVYQNWRACKAIEAQMAARAKCDSCSWFGLAGEDGCPPGMP